MYPRLNLYKKKKKKKKIENDRKTSEEICNIPSLIASTMTETAAMVNTSHPPRIPDSANSTYARLR